jgi:hypothetical protein
LQVSFLQPVCTALAGSLVFPFEWLAKDCRSRDEAHMRHIVAGKEKGLERAASRGLALLLAAGQAASRKSLVSIVATLIAVSRMVSAPIETVVPAALPRS